MSDEGDERRKRLKALKEKASKNIKFRNYRPQDAKLKEKASDSSNSASGDGNNRSNEQDERKRPTDDGGKEGEKQRAPTESLIQQELKKQKVAQDEDDLNIAPKKVNWDLKRGAEKKLQKLERRTQRAIVEIIRERMAEEAEYEEEEDDEGDNEEEDDDEGDSEEDDNEEDDGGEDSEEDDGED